jgi:hypothetical protein
MTTISDIGTPGPGPSSHSDPERKARSDHRGSWIPTWGMITTRFMELRKRRGLMIALIAVNIGIPVVFLAVRLISHAVDPKSYGPAGGLQHLHHAGARLHVRLRVHRGRRRRLHGGGPSTSLRGCSVTWSSPAVPAWPCIWPGSRPGWPSSSPWWPIGYTIVCAVCVFAAPTQLNYDGGDRAAGALAPGAGQLGRAARRRGDLQLQLPGQRAEPAAERGPAATVTGQRSPARCHHQDAAGHRSPSPCTSIASSDSGVRHHDRQSGLFADYSATFTVPPTSLMFDVGLWIALEATIGFIVGLGLASLMGQRTVPVILLVMLELILTPIFSRAIVYATCSTSSGASLASPCSISSRASSRRRSAGAVPVAAVAGPGHLLRPESTLAASLVIVGWIVFWTAIGAWRMRTRDA